jgi:hypothetical protein
VVLLCACVRIGLDIVEYDDTCTDGWMQIDEASS